LSPILGIWASQISGHLWQPQGAYDALSTVTVPSGGLASITFAGIPNTYKHLQIRTIAKSTSTGSQGDLTFNGDTGSNYAWHQLFGNGSSAGADNSTSRANIVGVASLVASSITSVFSASIIDILDYTANKNKTVRHLVGQDENGSGVISLNSGLWMNTSAINTITITARSNAIAQFSQFTLYGVK
jgi:hypothetical protein